GRADGNEVTLRQYQADGSTGLARGGTAFEDAVVIEVLVPKPAKPLDLVEVVASTTFKDKDGKDVVKVVTGKAAYDPVAMRVRLENLEEGEWRWRAKQIPADKGADSPKEPEPVSV